VLEKSIKPQLHIMVDAVEQEAECRRIMQDPSALEAFLQDLPNSAGALDLIGSCAKECTPNKRLLALTAVPTLLLILQGDGEPADAVQQALLAIYNLEIKMATERPFPLRSILTQPTCYSVLHPLYPLYVHVYIYVPTKRTRVGR
jgi:hypothetical protein